MTNDRKRSDRGIDLTIDIDATLQEVWQALTTGEGIARWFAPYAAVTPGEGGSVSVGWDPKEMWEQPITVALTTPCRFREFESAGTSVQPEIRRHTPKRQN